MKKIVLAGGCFWGVEAYYKLVEGVTGTRVGYANGAKENPTYREVCSGSTGHAEVCEVTYDESVISLNDILKKFFRIINPTLMNRQGNDRGTQYRTGIYYTDPTDKELIDEFIKGETPKYSSPIVTEIEPLDMFYDAEDYHQEYLDKNPGGYCHIDLSTAKFD